MKKLLVMMTVLAMCAMLGSCAKAPINKDCPSSAEYKRASDKDSLKKTVEFEDAETRENATNKESKTMRKELLWWHTGEHH